MIVVGIDPSLTGTGLAVLTTNGRRIDTALRTIGSTGKRSDTWPMRAARLTKLRNTVMRHVPRTATLAVLEGPSYGSSTPGMHDNAWYRGKLYDALVSLGIPTAVCPPATLKKWATDNGNADKDAMSVSVSALWPIVEWRNDNEVDGLGLASIGAQHIGMPVPYLILERHKLAISKVEWPTINGYSQSR